MTQSQRAVISGLWLFFGFLGLVGVLALLPPGPLSGVFFIILAVAWFWVFLCLAPAGGPD